jgi:hypothetical protein
MPPIAPLLVLDPIAGYAAVAATLQPGEKYQQPFDHVTFSKKKQRLLLDLLLA